MNHHYKYIFINRAPPVMTPVNHRFKPNCLKRPTIKASVEKKIFLGLNLHNKNGFTRSSSKQKYLYNQAFYMVVKNLILVC